MMLRRYILISAMLHVLVFSTLLIPAWVWEPKNESTPAMIPMILDSMLPPPVPPEKATPEPTSKEKPTPESTELRAIAGEAVPTPSPTATPTSTRTKKPSATPTATPSPVEATVMPTETSTEQAATSTATVKPTEKSTEKPTKTPKPTGTKEATSTTVSTVTPQATATQAASGTPTADKTATLLAEAARQLANAVSRAQDVLPPQAPPVQGDDVAGVGVDTSGFYSQGNGIRTNFRFEDAEYLSRLREVLQRNFVPPRMATSEGKRTATIYFKVMRNGVITDIRVDKSSGHKRFDQIAMETVEAVSPFEALPKGTGELGITCDFVSEEE